jgi:hypothetical protein
MYMANALLGQHHGGRKCEGRNKNGGPSTCTRQDIALFQVFQVEAGNGNNYGKILKWQLLGQFLEVANVE